MSIELLYKIRRFWPLFWTQFSGALNDNFFKNAFVMLITYKSASIAGMTASQIVPMAGGIFILPFFLFSATAGQIADKYQKAKIIKITKYTELFVMCLATVGLFLSNFELLLFVLFLMGTQSAFFGPLKYGIIPQLVHDHELVTGNAYIASGTFIAILVGTICGGIFSSFESYQYWVSGGLILVSLIGIFTSHYVQEVKVFNSEVKVDYTFIKPTWNILRLTMKDKDIFYTVLGISWFWFLGAAILSLVPIFCKEVMHGNTYVGTMFLATFTIGMGVGSILTEKISGKNVEMGVVAIASLVLSIFLIDLHCVGLSFMKEVSGSELLGPAQFFKQSGSIHAFFDLFMISICGGMYIVPQMTYVQEISDEDKLSRTIAGNNIWNALFMVSSAGFLMVISTLGIPKSILIVAILNIIVSFFQYAYRSLDTVRFLGWILSHLFYNFKVKGKENLPENGPFIILCNHVSFIDWLFIYAAIKPSPQFIIDWAYYYMPLGPFWFKQGGLIPIATKKESKEVLEKAYKALSNNIQNGSVLAVFPEGTITRNGEMNELRPGILKVIKENPVPIIPISLNGLWGSVFSFEGGHVIFKIPKSLRRKITLTISKPIDPKDLTTKEELDKVGDIIKLNS